MMIIWPDFLKQSGKIPNAGVLNSLLVSLSLAKSGLFLCLPLVNVWLTWGQASAILGLLLAGETLSKK